jgi:hypothetical protein
VAHVGDVLDVQHFEPLIEQSAPDEVGQQEAAEIADVREAVNRRSARVHANAPGLDRFDRFDLAGERVSQAKVHVGSMVGPGHPTAASRFAGIRASCP